MTWHRVSFLSLATAMLVSTGCQQPTITHRATASGEAAHEYRDLVVEASCGQCQLGLEGSGCDLAVRIDGESYFVDGTGIDDHGDAHADDGFCNAVRHARVSGQVADGRFVATSFELLPE